MNRNIFEIQMTEPESFFRENEKLKKYEIKIR